MSKETTIILNGNAAGIRSPKRASGLITGFLKMICNKLLKFITTFTLEIVVATFSFFFSKMHRLTLQLVKSFRIPINARPIRQFTTSDTSSKIDKIVDEISTLNLLEASQLIKQLKIKLNISEVAVAMPAQPAAGAVAAPSAEPKDDKPEVQTQFKVTLSKFEPAKKAKVIKEIKQILPGANLVEVIKYLK